MEFASGANAFLFMITFQRTHNTEGFIFALPKPIGSDF